jgi:hypothetical protein
MIIFYRAPAGGKTKVSEIGVGSGFLLFATIET